MSKNRKVLISIRITHTRKFNHNELLQNITDKWGKPGLRDYTRAHEMEIAITPLSKI